MNKIDNTVKIPDQNSANNWVSQRYDLISELKNIFMLTLKFLQLNFTQVYSQYFAMLGVRQGFIFFWLIFITYPNWKTNA